MSLTPEDLMAELHGLPEQIRAREKEVIRLAKDYSTNMVSLAKREREIAAIVASERTDGKPTFSNETLRKAETDRRLAEDEVATRLRNAAEAIKGLLESEKVELTCLENRKSIGKGILDYLSSNKRGGER